MDKERKKVVVPTVLFPDANREAYVVGSRRAERRLVVQEGAKRRQAHRTYNVAMFCDYFYPNMGGVENHIYQVASCLVQRGHKVIVVTHNYGERKGIRYLASGVKVYYIPQKIVYLQNSFPNYAVFLPWFRYITIREQIDIVHCHSAFSTFAMEVLLHSSVMGVRSCFTDHSLFGFADASSVIMNKILKSCISDVKHVICVSNTSKENTVLRAQIHPKHVSVIPNAVNSNGFTPNPSARDPNKITIVVVSRLVYRKGADLLVELIPPICQKFPQVQFLIGGDGPKLVELEEMRERHQLHDRVELLGGLHHAKVRGVLTRGDIFLNCSLTEAFCIAIVEAASCGLLVISTEVGGVPEVLPPHMMKLAQPDAASLVAVLEETLSSGELERRTEEDFMQFHQQVQQMYSWWRVTEKTEKVYDKIWDSPIGSTLERMKRHYGSGWVIGKMIVGIYILSLLFLAWFAWFQPVDEIDVALPFPAVRFRRTSSRALQHRIEDDEKAKEGATLA
ncbi:phosphatidylinositol N-acetylglucosaminyltransferase [Balamuthia mandrillaris]